MKRISIYSEEVEINYEDMSYEDILQTQKVVFPEDSFFDPEY